MRKTKKLLSVLLVVCMIVPMAIAAVVPATAAVSGTGAGVVADDGNGIYYQFPQITNVGDSGNGGNAYQTEQGLKFYSWNTANTFSNDSDGNLIIAVGEGSNDVRICFMDGFNRPDDAQFQQAGFGLDYFTIRYKVVTNGIDNSGYVGTDKEISINGANNLSGTNSSFVIPSDEEWIETIYPLTGDLGYWGTKVDGNDFYNEWTTHWFTFPQLASGTSLVIDYIGLYKTEESAKAAQDKMKGIPAVDVPSGNIYEASKTITVTPVDGTTVYYTTDGSDPTTNGTVYTNPITITVDTCLKVAPYFTATEKFGSVYTYNYHFSPDLTYTYYDPNETVESQAMKAQVFRFNGVKTSDNWNYTMDSGLTMSMETARSYSNDADGNLLINLKQSGQWNATCFNPYVDDKGMPFINMVLATVFEIRYKAVDANGNVRGKENFDGNVYINDMSSMSVNKSTTVEDGEDGWLITRVVYNESTWEKFEGTWDLVIPEVVGGTITVDYIGFFRDENVADAHGKFDDVCDGEKVTFYGAQKKLDGNGVRFIGVIDDYTDTDYAEFGFKVQVGTKIVDAKIKKYVYDGFVNDGETVKIEDVVTGAGENTKFFTFCINDIPDSALVDGSITFTVCAYATINGTAAYGTPSTFVYTPATSTLVAA